MIGLDGKFYQINKLDMEQLSYPGFSMMHGERVADSRASAECPLRYLVKPIFSQSNISAI